MPTRILSFTVTTNVLELSSGRKCLELTARPLADGHVLTDAHVFDAGAVLAARSTPAELYPFTCGCGVAGCAGIHDPARLSSDEKTVTWSFPEEWFRGDLNVDLFPTGQPLDIHFDRRQYETALDDLAARFQSLADEAGLPGLYALGHCLDVVDEYLDTPLAVRLADARERFLDYQDREEWRRRTFGDLFHLQLRVAMPDGQVLATSVERLAYLVAERTGLEDGDAQEAFVETEVVPRFRENREAILEAGRSMPWEALEWSLWTIEDSRPEEEQHRQVPMEKMAAMWDTAVLSLAEDRQ